MGSGSPRRLGRSAWRSPSPPRCGGWRAGAGAAYDSLTALVLVGCLAAGVILASDVYHSGSNVEQLLFGSLLLVDGADIRLAIVSTAAILRREPAVRPPLAGKRVRRGRRAHLRGQLAGRRPAGPDRACDNRGARRDWRAAGGRALRGAGSDRPAVREPHGHMAARVGAARRRRGNRRALAVGQDQRPPRGDDRNAQRGGVRSRSRRSAPSAPAGWGWSRRPGLLLPCSALGAGARDPTRARSRWSPRQRRSATSPARSAATRSTSIRSSPRTPIPTTTSRAPMTSPRQPTRRSSSPMGTTSTRGWARSSTTAAATPRWWTSAPPSR